MLFAVVVVTGWMPRVCRIRVTHARAASAALKYGDEEVRRKRCTKKLLVPE